PGGTRESRTDVRRSCASTCDGVAHLRATESRIYDDRMRDMAGDNVVIVGFMGAGKSVCGRLLARRLGRCFVETDDMIVSRDGRSIPDIFRQDGEDAFRRLEGEALAALALKSGDVIATGGGLPCRDDRIEALRALGTVVWLRGDLGELLTRAERIGGRPMLYARGVPLAGCFDVLNLNNLRVVQAVHADYIAAGADAIETNTFGANRFKLAVHGVEAQVREINRRGARLARDVRESAGRDVWVLGSIGPLGKYLEPLGAVTADEAREAFREQAEALLEGGVDAFVVETFSDLAEIALAVGAIRAITDLPVIAQMAFTDEGVTFMGRPPAEVARTLRALGAQALGANCSVGSSTLYDVLERMVPEAGGLPLAIQPNAGL